MKTISILLMLTAGVAALSGCEESQNPVWDAHYAESRAILAANMKMLNSSAVTLPKDEKVQWLIEHEDSLHRDEQMVKVGHLQVCDIMEVTEQLKDIIAETGAARPAPDPAIQNCIAYGQPTHEREGK